MSKKITEVSLAESLTPAENPTFYVEKAGTFRRVTLAQMEGCLNDGITAAPFSAATAYAAGDYVVYNGKLYCFTANHAAGAWTGSDASARKLADEMSNIKSAIEDVSGLSDEAKDALLACFAHVAWVDEHGQDYYDALEEALTTATWAITNNLTNCTTSNAATSVQKGGSYSATITASAGYVMTGATVSITMGGNDITATAYSNGVISIAAVTGALVITISAVAKTVSSISAVYTQSGTVVDIDTLDDLKADLVVTATYTDSSTATVPATEYDLSGTLAVGTSTITVTYSSKTTTFSVTVTQAIDTTVYETVDYLTSAVHGTPSSSHLSTTPYIKTGWPATDTDTINYTIELIATPLFSGVSSCIFGGRNAKNAGGTTLGTVLTYDNNSSGHDSLVWGNATGTTTCLITYFNDPFEVNKKTRFTLTNGDIYIDGTFVASTNANTAVQSASYPWALFGRNNQGSYTTAAGGGDRAPFIGKIYSFTIKDGNGNYVLRYIPCKRLSDDTYGMWDVVGQTFKESEISDGFSGGND